MPKLELKEVFLWEQSSHHSPKQNGIVLAHVRRLKLSSGKSSWGSAATHASTQSIMQDVSPYPSCRAFSSSWQSVSGHQKEGEASLRFRDVLGTRAKKRRVKADPVAVLYNCFKRSHRDGRMKFCVVVATGIMASGSGHGLPHERLNMRKNDVPWRAMLQENTCLNRWADLCLMFMTWLNEATCDLL